MRHSVLHRGSAVKNLTHLCVFIGLIIYHQSRSAEGVSELYSGSVSYECVVCASWTRLITVRSKTECAVACLENVDCLTFNFVDLTSKCQISNGAVAGANGPVYGPYRRCPIGNGYKVYKGLGLELCLRLEPSRVNQNTAKQECIRDGGHLALIDSKEKRLFVKKVLEMHCDASLWIDGEDKTGSGNLTDWKGEELSYFEWSDDEPTDDDCLIISSIFEFRFSDLGCADTRGYICQID